jgi:hypothetical protein
MNCPRVDALALFTGTLKQSQNEAVGDATKELTMPGLSSELYNRCRTILLKCSEFDSNASLRTVFATDELYPFHDRLPVAANKSERVDKCLEFLLDKCLSNGRPVLPLFLAALRDRYQEGDALRDELETLVVAVQFSEGTKAESIAGPRYGIRFEGRTEGVVIGDRAQVTQHFGAPPTNKVERELSPADERAFLERELAQHRRNLYHLREKKAKYGIDVPISVLNQIEDEEREIRHIEGELERLER